LASDSHAVHTSNAPDAFHTDEQHNRFLEPKGPATMRATPAIRPAAIVGAALLAACLAAAIVAPNVVTTARGSVASDPIRFATSGTQAGGPLRTRITGMPISVRTAGSSMPASEVAATPLPSKAKQISVLAAVLKNMRKNYTAYLNINPGPADVFDYDVGPLWLKGIDGAGTTIAVIEGWNYPSIQRVVASYDKTFGLPNPQIETIYPSGDGKLPAKCPAGMVALGSYGSCSGWAGELTLDVLTAHLMAPYAKILISVTPADSQITDDAASQVAPPEMMQALETISAEHLANVVSISDGSGEASYRHGPAEITAQNPGELAAAAAGIPVLVASGDTGVVMELPVFDGDQVTKTPDTGTWDDSPWVTAVGGSVPNLSSTGRRLGPDPLWDVGRYSEGAGYSSVFARPAYQNGVASITHSSMRSVPDITMDAREGTSEAAPMLAGILALATQMNHANVGPINPALYGVLGPKGAADGIADVVSGNDSYRSPSGAVVVPGFTAAKGFDVASGWGTIYAPLFVPNLVAATQAAKQDSASRRQARAELTTLRRAVTLSPTAIGSKGISYLFATGFLPGHPVRLLIDNSVIGTLTASALGTVTYMIDPVMLKLAAGKHTLLLESMLITVTRSFSSSGA
jgi:subtilase family serine protease